MSTLIAAPLRPGPETLVRRLWREGLQANASVDDETCQMVVGSRAPDHGSPRWTPARIAEVAFAREAFVTEAREGGFDELWMVDDDVVCGPGVLERMRQVEADVVYGVFWTQSDWGGRWGNWPQVWMTHPYGFVGHPEAWDELTLQGEARELPVAGGGACTLLRGEALSAAPQYHPLLEGLRFAGGMWCGEDRSFALRCAVRGVSQIAVTNLPIVHLHGLEVEEGSDEGQELEDAVRQHVGL